MKIGYKISDNFVVIKCPKNGCTTVMIQSLCYNEHKKIDEYNDLEFKHVVQSIHSQLWEYSSKYLINCDNVKNYPTQKLIFIFRDPIKRFLSAYKNRFIDKIITIDEFVKFAKEDIETHKDNINNIEEHCRPQYAFINFDDIDIFIEQKDYEMFCKEQGIQYLKANQNKDLSYQSKIELTDEHISILKDLYKEDYEMIKKIKNSGKLYMGSYKDTETIIKHTVICICGKSGAGKTTTANRIKDELGIHNIVPVILDGDAIRKYVNYDLTYSDEDRKRNNEIVANIAELLYHQGHHVVISTVRADIAYDILSSKNIPCELIRL